MSLQLELPSFVHGNAKLPKSTMCFAIPSGFTCPGAEQCLAMVDRHSGELTHGPLQRFRCYSASEEKRFLSVRQGRWRNYDIIKGRPADELTDLLTLAIRTQMRGYTTHVRWFTAGDCFSKALRDAIIGAARRTMPLVHYLYSKNLPIWLDGERLLQLPENLFLTASWGGKFDHLLQQGVFPRTARVVTTEEEAEALGLPIDYTDAYAYDPEPQHFAHLVHGPQGGALWHVIQQRRDAGQFAGYSAKTKGLVHV